MNTVQLECFLSVAKNLNFSKASEEVRISQPAVSHQINSLEKELDTKLFLRTSKNVSLTAEGLLFMPDADKILKIANSAKARLSDHEKPVHLEIGCHSRMELSLMPDAIRSLRQEYPRLRPIMHMVPYEALPRLLDSGQLHVILGLKDSYARESFRYHELFSCPVVCICSRNHPLASETSVTSDMLTDDVVLYEPRRTYDAVLHMQSQIAAQASVGQRYFGDTYETLTMLVKAGFGYTVLPDIRFPRDPELCYIPVKNQESFSFGVYCRDKEEAPVVRRFWHLMKGSC